MKVVQRNEDKARRLPPSPTDGSDKEVGPPTMKLGRTERVAKGTRRDAKDTEAEDMSSVEGFSLPATRCE